MPQITIEYMIMIPLLILQIFLFPLTVGWIMTMWTESRQTLALREVAGHIGSAVHQLYSALSHQSILEVYNVTSKLATPAFIEGCAYTANATLREASGSSSESSKILDITVWLMDSNVAATASVTLGSNMSWEPSTFVSNSPNATLAAAKFSNGTISMRFMG